MTKESEQKTGIRVEEPKSELKRAIEELRTELKRDIKELEQRLTIKLGALFLAAIGITVTLCKLDFI